MSTTYSLRTLRIEIFTLLAVRYCFRVRSICAVRVIHVIPTVSAVLTVLLGYLISTATTVIAIRKVCCVSILFLFSTDFSVCAISAVCAVLPHSKVFAISAVSETCINHTVRTGSTIDVIRSAAHTEHHCYTILTFHNTFVIPSILFLVVHLAIRPSSAACL